MRKALLIIKNQKFNKLTVIKELKPQIQPSGQSKRKFLFKCDCGQKCEATLSNVMHGSTISCGCFNKEKAIKHGFTEKDSVNKNLYYIWHNMQKRCYNESSKYYKDYGGRGIRITKAWRGKEGIYNFINWAKETDYKSGLEIDRVNNDKGYFPKNCCWVTRRVNVNNRRNTVKVKHPITGKLTPFSYVFDEIANKNISYATAWTRYTVYDWPLIKALTFYVQK
jgi:hypothetical protein